MGGRWEQREQWIEHQALGMRIIGGVGWMDELGGETGSRREWVMSWVQEQRFGLYFQVNE